MSNPAQKISLCTECGKPLPDTSPNDDLVTSTALKACKACKETLTPPALPVKALSSVQKQPSKLARDLFSDAVPAAVDSSSLAPDPSQEPTPLPSSIFPETSPQFPNIQEQLLPSYPRNPLSPLTPATAPLSPVEAQWPPQSPSENNLSGFSAVVADESMSPHEDKGTQEESASSFSTPHNQQPSSAPSEQNDVNMDSLNPPKFPFPFQNNLGDE